MQRGKRFSVLGVALALAAIFAMALGGTGASAASSSASADSIVAQSAAKGLSKKAVLKLIRKNAAKLRGPAGPPGAPGAQGPPGLNGAPAGSTTQKFACKTNEGQNDPSCGT